jgi:hypothetical protein
MVEPDGIEPTTSTMQSSQFVPWVLTSDNYTPDGSFRLGYRCGIDAGPSDDFQSNAGRQRDARATPGKFSGVRFIICFSNRAPFSFANRASGEYSALGQEPEGSYTRRRV